MEKVILGADSIHRWANYIVGMSIPRWFIRKLGQKRRLDLIKYVRNVWFRVNDNPVRKVPRPKWLPKKYIWG
jgi:hypothetical protein